MLGCLYLLLLLLLVLLPLNLLLLLPHLIRLNAVQLTAMWPNLPHLAHSLLQEALNIRPSSSSHSSEMWSTKPQYWQAYLLGQYLVRWSWELQILHFLLGHSHVQCVSIVLHIEHHTLSIGGRPLSCLDWLMFAMFIYIYI